MAEQFTLTAERESECVEILYDEDPTERPLEYCEAAQDMCRAYRSLKDHVAALELAVESGEAALKLTTTETPPWNPNLFKSFDIALVELGRKPLWGYLADPTAAWNNSLCEIHACSNPKVEGTERCTVHGSQE